MRAEKEGEGDEPEGGPEGLLGHRKLNAFFLDKVTCPEQVDNRSAGGHGAHKSRAGDNEAARSVQRFRRDRRRRKATHFRAVKLSIALMLHRSP